MGVIRKRKPIDMMGYSFQTWKVIAQSQNIGSGNNARWLCECQICGNQKEFCGSEIRKGRTGVCKHKTLVTKSKTTSMSSCQQNSRVKDETNNHYGKLTVVSFAFSKNSFAYWNCICDCGNTIIARGNQLRNGQITSCGCLRSRKENEIMTILQKNNISFKREYSFDDLVDKNKLRFDFAIFDSNQNLIGLIEYQGLQHYESSNFYNHFGLLQIHDDMKRQYCQTNNIPLLELNHTHELETALLQWYFSLIPLT